MASFIYMLKLPVGGKDTQKQMDGGNELTRKLLARKYQEINHDASMIDKGTMLDGFE